jgi:WD40-like Beta Propeller Repeat
MCLLGGLHVVNSMLFLVSLVSCSAAVKGGEAKPCSPHALQSVPASAGGTEFDRALRQIAMSETGETLAFSGIYNHLVSDDNNGLDDVYLYDCKSGEIQLVSREVGGLVGSGASRHPSLSADGSVLAFASYAPQLVADDNDEFEDVFIVDLANKTIGRVRGAGAAPSGDNGYPCVSPDGRYVAFGIYGAVPPRINSVGVYDRQERTVVVWPSESAKAVLACESPSLGVHNDQLIIAANALVRDGTGEARSTVCSGVVGGEWKDLSKLREPLASIDWYAPVVSGNGRCIVWSANEGTKSAPSITVLRYDAIANKIDAVRERIHPAASYEHPSVSSSADVLCMACDTIEGDPTQLSYGKTRRVIRFVACLSGEWTTLPHGVDSGNVLSQCDWPVVCGDGSRIAYMMSRCAECSPRGELDRYRVHVFDRTLGKLRCISKR